MERPPLRGLRTRAVPAGQGMLRQRYIARRKSVFIFEESPYSACACSSFLNEDCLSHVFSDKCCQSTSAGEIYGDSCGRTGLGETPQRRRSEEALQPPTESEVYFPRGLDAPHKVPSYRTVYTNSVISNALFENSLKKKVMKWSY